VTLRITATAIIALGDYRHKVHPARIYKLPEMLSGNDSTMEGDPRLELNRDVTLRNIGRMLRETLLEWNRDRAQRMGASVAFYALLSLAPLLIILVTLAAMILGPQAAEGQLAYEVEHLIGFDAAKTLQAVVADANRPGVGFAATLISTITLILGASSVAVELQDTLNTILRVPGPRRTFIGFIAYTIRDRLYALAIVVAAGFLLLLSVSLSTWITAVGKFFGYLLPYPEGMLRFGEMLVSFVVMTGLLAAIYKVLPEIRLAWTDVIFGACLTSLFLTLGKQPLVFYLGKVSIGSTYGAAESLVVVLVWVYYAAQLFFLGAEFNKVYSRRLGSLRHRRIDEGKSLQL
jgi:membrane protein